MDTTRREFLMVGMYALSFRSNPKNFSQLSVIVLFLLLIMAGDYFLNLRRKADLEQRALFFYWLQFSKRFKIGYDKRSISASRTSG